MMTSLALPDRRDLRVDLYPRVTATISNCQLLVSVVWRVPGRKFPPLPDFITSARRELILSAVFLAFLVGAIVALQRDLMISDYVTELTRSGLAGDV